MQIITSIDDPRIEAYRTLKEREIISSGRFIAEGEHLVKRLLASSFKTKSVFIAEKHVEEIAKIVPQDVPLYVSSHDVMNQIIGYKFHSGIIACGLRGKKRTIDDTIRRSGKLTLMILPEIANAENLGGLIRVAAGFGVNAIILGERSCDPFLRQSVRVSMGNIFNVPMIESLNLAGDVVRLRDEFQVDLLATVLDDNAIDLHDLKREDRFAILLGNEAQGLPREMVELCQKKVTIPMQLGTDSLNVAVSAGIFLFHLNRRSSGGETADERG